MLLAISGLFLSSPASAQQEPPYWASIDEPEARMRTGPSTEYPTMWIYKREKLPVKILARYKSWRKVEDHEGTQGWMHARLLSASRTGLAEPGVVGSLTECEKGWCLFDVTGRKGYISVADIWGDEPLK